MGICRHRCVDLLVSSRVPSRCDAFRRGRAAATFVGEGTQIASGPSAFDRGLADSGLIHGVLLIRHWAISLAARIITKVSGARLAYAF